MAKRRNPLKRSVRSDRNAYREKMDYMGPARNEFGYNEDPPKTSRFLCIKIFHLQQCSKHSGTMSKSLAHTTSRFLCIRIIDSNVKKFGYYESPPTTSSFLGRGAMNNKELGLWSRRGLLAYVYTGVSVLLMYY